MFYVYDSNFELRETHPNMQELQDSILEKEEDIECYQNTHKALNGLIIYTDTYVLKHLDQLLDMKEEQFIQDVSAQLDLKDKQIQDLLDQQKNHNTELDKLKDTIYKITNERDKKESKIQKALTCLDSLNKEKPRAPEPKKLTPAVKKSKPKKFEPAPKQKPKNPKSDDNIDVNWLSVISHPSFPLKDELYKKDTIHVKNIIKVVGTKSIPLTESWVDYISTSVLKDLGYEKEKANIKIYTPTEAVLLIGAVYLDTKSKKQGIQRLEESVRRLYHSWHENIDVLKKELGE